MATLVCFHAHPDDEAIITGGVMAQAAEAGHRVVLVVATRGEHGETPEGLLRPGETLVERRVDETMRSAEALGVARVEFLGYTDSGMEGWPANDAEGAFCRADVDEAAARLAAILDEEHADVLTIYDSNGGYGHPDHVKVHRVGNRAFELAQVSRLYEATFNRDYYLEMTSLMTPPEGVDVPDMPDVEEMSLGVRASEITTAVDVTKWLEQKRAAMSAHRSQIAETSFFLALPEEPFRAAFGIEWFVRRDRAPGEPWETDLFEGIA